MSLQVIVGWIRYDISVLTLILIYSNATQSRAQTDIGDTAWGRY